MRFARERVEDIWTEALPLMRAHHAEVGCLAHEEFDPDLSRYLAAERADLLAVFTARSASGRLVGYASHLVAPHFHYRSRVVALQDALFVEKPFRGRGAFRFLAWCDRELAGFGAHVVIRQVTSQRNYSRLLERQGYALFERQYMRKL
jgi:GNAT superfamily N-acetyltransferase